MILKADSLEHAAQLAVQRSALTAFPTRIMTDLKYGTVFITDEEVPTGYLPLVLVMPEMKGGA